MKTKITLALVLFFLIFKIQAQTPSINETSRTSYLDYSFDKQHDENIAHYKKLNEKLEEKKKKEAEKENSNLTDINKIDLEIKTNADLIKSLENVKSRYGEIKVKENYENYYERIIQLKRDSINLYVKAVENNKLTLKEIDSIYKLINKKRKEIDDKNIEKEEKLAELGKFPWLLPSWKKVNRKKFFHDMYSNNTDKTILLNSFTLNGNSDAGAVQTEIVTDNMWATRVSFGSVLSISNDQENETSEDQTQKETEEEAFSRLINGGGNFYLDVILPIFTTNPNNGNQITCYGYANIRGAMDIEGFSSNVDTSTGNGTLGLNGYLGISSDNKKFNFFVQGNTNFTFGTNEFYKNLGLYNEKPFLNGKLIAGVTILNQFRLSAIINTFGSDEKIRSNKFVIGIQVLPGL